MNGPQHYRKAEHLLIAANDRHAQADNDGAEILTRQAHVHATLALAAATVEDMESTELRAGWAEIVDEEPLS